MSDMAYGFSYVNAGEVIALGSALPAVCILVVALRFFTRKVQKVGLKPDDWLAFAALWMVIGMGACCIAGAKLGAWGWPTPNPPPGLSADEQANYEAPSTTTEQIIEFPFQLMMIIAYGLIKVSYLFFYRRIFVSHRGGKVDIFLIFMVVVVALWTLSFILLIIFDCGKHIDANWGSGEAQQMYCVPYGFTSEYGMAVSDLILDCFIFLIPVPLIFKLQMSTKRKFAVLGVFLLGASAVGASVARLILYIRELQELLPGTEVDPQLTATLAFYWSMLEAGLALIAACLPPMAYLFSHWREIPIISSVTSSLSRMSLVRMDRSQRSDQTNTTKTSMSESDYGSVHKTDPYSFIDNDKPQDSIARTVDIDVEHHAATGTPIAATTAARGEYFPGEPR